MPKILNNSRKKKKKRSHLLERIPSQYAKMIKEKSKGRKNQNQNQPLVTHSFLKWWPRRFLWCFCCQDIHSVFFGRQYVKGLTWIKLKNFQLHLQDWSFCKILMTNACISSVLCLSFFWAWYKTRANHYNSSMKIPSFAFSRYCLISASRGRLFGVSIALCLNTLT